MSFSGENSDDTRYAAIRTGVSLAGIVILLLISFLWIESYFTATKWYRSNWRGTETEAIERATWLFSNYGSFGFAWRRQVGDLGGSFPEDAREFTRFNASPTALQHIHPVELWSWHWIEHHVSPRGMMGAIRHDNGHLFIPYWMPFLLLLLVVISMNTERQTGTG